MTNTNRLYVLQLIVVVVAGIANAQRYNVTHLEYTQHNASSVAAGNWSDNHHDDLRSHYSATVDTFLGSASVLYGLLGQSQPVKSSAQCHNQLMAIYEGIHRRDVWAMKSKKLSIWCFYVKLNCV